MAPTCGVSFGSEPDRAFDSTRSTLYFDYCHLHVALFIPSSIVARYNGVHVTTSTELDWNSVVERPIDRGGNRTRASELVRESERVSGGVEE